MMPVAIRFNTCARKWGSMSRQAGSAAAAAAVLTAASTCSRSAQEITQLTCPVAGLIDSNVVSVLTIHSPSTRKALGVVAGSGDMSGAPYVLVYIFCSTGLVFCFSDLTMLCRCQSRCLHYEKS